MLDSIPGFHGHFGVAHADETFLQFSPGLPLNKADQGVSDNLMTLWKNFINMGNPSSRGV